MASPSAHQRLFDRLRDALSERVARELVSALAAQRLIETVDELFEELGELSFKVSGEAVRALPEFERRCGLETVVPWLDLGIVFTQRSGALGLRYFKESPLIVGLIDGSTVRHRVLTLLLERADGAGQDAIHCTFELFRRVPELLTIVSVEDVPSWADVGEELAAWNYVVGNEFLQQIPAIARAIEKPLVREWVQYGMKLITQNSLGKPDYLGTLEFFRTSPRLLEPIEPMEVKQWVIRLGSALADQSPAASVSFLAEVSTYLDPLPTAEWRNRILKYGLLIAERDAETTLPYLRRAVELLGLGGETEQAQHLFDEWFAGGMEVLGYSVEGGRAYFALETRGALTAVEQAMNGVALRQVARSLKLFVQGLCGTAVQIEPLPDALVWNRTGSSDTRQPTRATVSPDGTTILVPPLVNWGASKADNERFYLVMVAHEAGHLEFGTYTVPVTVLQRVARDAHARYAAPGSSAPESLPIESLADVFHWYPEPGVMRDLWEILEDARIEHLLQHSYPGLKKDLAALTKASIQLRSFLHGMTAREMVMDQLLLRFAGERPPVPLPESLSDVMERVWTVAKTILRPDATASDAILTADCLYQILDEMIGHLPGADQIGWTARDETDAPLDEVGIGPPAAESAGEYRPITNWAYRGQMDPHMVHGQTDGQHADREWTDPWEDRPPSSVEAGEPRAASNLDAGLAPDASDKRDSRYGTSPLEQWLEAREAPKARGRGERERSGEWWYDEWDGTIRDYRPRWCRVVEHLANEGSPEFVDHTLRTYAPEVKRLRRYFETIRPTALRRIGRQERGDDFDLDALVSWVSDRRLGRDPSDRIYVRRDKRERQVAVAFLLDISGSTGRQLVSEQRRVIDVEKESLVLLSEALHAIGDRYALYAYSGQGKEQVDVMVLKDFDEASIGRAALRIGQLSPQKQNRDGAAIRHVIHRLMQQQAKVRLLVLISDGKPLDDAYAEEYALEDTKMALREACAKGIHPFCITIDQEASSYLRRMYGEVGYIVVDEVGTLPMRVPRIYQRLTT